MTVRPAHPAAGPGAPVDWTSLRRVVVARLDNLGDVVLTGPALRALRVALAPGARLDLLTSPVGATVAPLLPWVDEVIAWRASWQDATGSCPLSPDRELALVDRLRGYDAMVVSTSFSQSPWPPAYAAALAGVRVRVGQSREFGGSVLTHWITPAPDDEEAHQVDRALRMLSLVGVPARGTQLELVVPPAARRRALHATGRAPYVLVAPGASCPSRRYDAGRFRCVVRRLEAAGVRVVVVGSGREAGLVGAVSAGTRARGLAGALDVPPLAAAVRRASAVVTNNSGCLHLADALRTPQVVLFAGTERESQYAPRSGGPAVVLRRPTGCSPCRAFACPYARECLDLPPGDVAEAVLGLLSDGEVAA